MSEVAQTSELCNRFAQLYTGAVTDVLDEMGYRSQTMDIDIEPLTREMSMAGVAYPIEGRPNQSVDHEQNIRNILRMLGDAPEHTILAYETHDSSSAQLGELSVTALEENNCRGAVIDGGVRDVEYILESDFPVFTRYRTPADCIYRWELVDWGVPATVGGVRVTPGDMIVGDVDGVVVVPEEIQATVLDEAEALKESENDVRDAVADGTPPLDAYEQYGTF